MPDRYNYYNIAIADSSFGFPYRPSGGPDWAQAQATAFVLRSHLKLNCLAGDMVLTYVHLSTFVIALL